MHQYGTKSKSAFGYKGSRRGAEWHKWDLHLHSPASVVQHYGDAGRNETWEEYISALEALPSEIKAIAINDYFVLDGYQRVRAAKEMGRLSNLELILPSIELRLTALAGHSSSRKINYHVIFSDELSVDQIRMFFFDKLSIDYDLGNGKKWQGYVCHLDHLADFGRAIKAATPDERQSSDSELRTGFLSAAFDLELIRRLLDQHIFKGHVITAVGRAEWDQMRWDGGSGAVKKDLINSVDLVLTASPSPEKYFEQVERLRVQGVNSRLLDGSDAHYYAYTDQSNRLGVVFTWLKADLTFQGLRRVLQRFEDRVSICELGKYPPKLQHMQSNKTRYIRGIEIRKKADSALEESWFDCDIPLNGGLAAIIGNQGNGKSALTDIVALCGSTKVKEFSFLNTDKFCDGQNKAGAFEAVLTWHDGTETSRSLDHSVKDTEVERVCYVPQRFFELVTNEKTVREGGKFYGEIKKVIFSHIDPSDRLDCSNFDELLAVRTKELERSLSLLRQDLDEINAGILQLEELTAPIAVEQLFEEIEVKKKELEAHESNRPVGVSEPVENSEVHSRIEELREQEENIQREIEDTEVAVSRLKRKRELIDQTKQAVENERRRVEKFINDLRKQFAEEDIEIDLARVISLTIDAAPLSAMIEECNQEIDNMRGVLDLHSGSSLAQSLQRLREVRYALESQLEEASKEYQKYRTELAEWQSKQTAIIGDTDTPATLEWLKHRLANVQGEKVSELNALREKRNEKTREIHGRLSSLVRVFQDLTRPVKAHIETHYLTKEKYRLDFAIELREQGFEDSFFNIVRQDTGAFIGLREGRDRLKSIVDKYDFSSADDAVTFAEDVLENLKRNYRGPSRTEIVLDKLVRKGHQVSDLYNLLFGLKFVQPQYGLALGGKPLKLLSPGERGILLLVFYLVVDQGNEPLIIDQPEGNLNNQSIFDNLVPVFAEAKQRRQIIIVTHNPNLAVVCDAEQIIHAEIDFDEGNHVTYQSGALENPIFNKLSLDVLEGTPPAFEERKLTYEL